MRTHANTFQEDPNDEPLGESFLKLWGWVGALAVLAVTAAAQVSDIDDHSAEWAQSQAIEAAQQRDAESERRERAGQEMCSSDFGPQVLAVWVDDTTVECVNPRGQRLSSSPSAAIEVARAAR